MKAFNLLALSVGLAAALCWGLCLSADYCLPENARVFVMPLALAIGLSARRITQFLLGYTLEEAMGVEDEQKN